MIDNQLAPPAEERCDAVQATLDRFRRVRQWTERLCETLEPEDCTVQSMPEASPTRWHLAHTTWFFETFVLKTRADYQPCHAQYEYLFNSYYNGVGSQFPRPRRGVLSRPSQREVWEYRREVEQRLEDWLREADEAQRSELLPIVELGLHHEQQHQELLLTDIKHAFSCNPLLPDYRPRREEAEKSEASTPRSWCRYAAGLHVFGHGGLGFCYDNETPRHRAYVSAFQLADRLTTNREYLEFIEDGGYRRSELWLSLGWDRVQNDLWQAPLYWMERDGAWWQFTLHGLQPLRLDEPVCHVSYFEADAYSRWCDARLPTEYEWELAAKGQPIAGNLLDEARFHPAPLATPRTSGPAQMFGDVWEWTSSPYVGYPGYRPSPGAIGEYNGKFMCNQYVLRGGSCATPSDHLRSTYRNFFPPEARWQFTGIRLAR